MVTRLSQRAHDVAELLQHVHLAAGVRHKRRDHVQRVALARALLYPLVSPRRPPFLGLVETAETPAHLRAVRGRVVGIRLAGRQLVLVGR